MDDSVIKNLEIDVPNDLKLGDRAMCSINSIDKVLSVQQKHPELFQAMRKICMKRFKNFGIDDLRAESTLGGDYVSKYDDRITNGSITANVSLTIDRFNSATTDQYISVGDGREYHTNSECPSVKSSSTLCSSQYVHSNEGDGSTSTGKSVKRFISFYKNSS